MKSACPVDELSIKCASSLPSVCHRSASSGVKKKRLLIVGSRFINQTNSKQNQYVNKSM